MKRIVSLIDWSATRELGAIAGRIDDLAKSIFDPDVPPTEVRRLYLPATVAQEDLDAAGIGVDLDDIARELPPGLGIFERVVETKIRSKIRRVMCIQGDIGCGKSFLIRCLSDGVLRDHEHCETPEALPCGGKRLIITIDFNLLDYLYATDPEKIQRRLTRDIGNAVRAKLTKSGLMTDDEELGGFWDEESERVANENLGTSAFTTILAEREKNARSGQDTIRERESRLKKRVLLDQEPNKRLDYLARLLRYIKVNRYQNREGCILLIFDNIDRTSPAVQGVLLSIVESHASTSEVHWILLMRPETFAAAGWNTHVEDKIPHIGPTVLEVIADRLGRFCADPSAYDAPMSALTQTERSEVTAWLQELNERLFLTEEYGPVRDFLDRAAGNSIRYGLILAQTLVRLDHSPAAGRERTPYNIVRALVRRGQSHFRETEGLRFPVTNIFHVRGQLEATYLAEPRVLRYLDGSPDGSAKLSDLVAEARAFGYPQGHIETAFNELLSLDHQLVRSDRFDHFDVLDTRTAASTYIAITELGRGYVQHLMYDLSYVHEVMVDCAFEERRWPRRLRYDYMPERFHALTLFLNAILESDVRETRAYVRGTAGKRRSTYIQRYGDMLLSARMIAAIEVAIAGIVDSVYSEHPDARGTLAPTIETMRSLRIQAINASDDVLGLQHGSDLPETPEPIRPTEAGGTLTAGKVIAFTWTAAPSAIDYRIEIQLRSESAPEWHLVKGSPHRSRGKTRFARTVQGATAIRWRVWSVGIGGTEGAKCDWVECMVGQPSVP